MEKYWSAIYAAWSNTLVTEHEYMAIPAIYTPELVAQLKQHLIDAEKMATATADKAPANKVQTAQAK